MPHNPETLGRSKEAKVTTLDERFEASRAVLAGLGRVDPQGEPLVGVVFQELAPDQWRVIREACFGVLWTRPQLSMRERSLATVAALVVLRRDENLRGHLLSALDLGLPPEAICEALFQLLFYVGAPMVNTALRVAYDCFKERGLTTQPVLAFDSGADPDALYRRGVATRRAVLGDAAGRGFDNRDAVDADWERYLLEYLWGAVWPRPELDLRERCLCTLTAQAVVGTDHAIVDYVRAARRLGYSADQVKELFFHLNFYVGDAQARRGAALAQQALANPG